MNLLAPIESVKTLALRALPDTRALDPAQRAKLLALAGTSSTRPWNLEFARNAHATNTPGQMEHALRGSYDVLEGDLRVDSAGRLVMAHDPTQLNGMPFDDWLAIAGRSGRGIKVDVKEPEAIAEAVRKLRASGVPQARIILNIPIGTGGANSATVGEMALIKRGLPRSTVNLSNQRYPYDGSQLQQLRAASDYFDGRVMFPIRADQVTPELARSLSPYGRVAVWNEPWFGDVDSVTRERRRLRDVGATGTIDLRTRPDGGPVRTLMDVRDRADEVFSRVRGWVT